MCIMKRLVKWSRDLMLYDNTQTKITGDPFMFFSFLLVYTIFQGKLSIQRDYNLMR
jgi:hypothetical protein